MLMYFGITSIGLLFTLFGAVFLILMFVWRDVTFWGIVQTVGALLIGGFLLWMTLPSMKAIVTKDYDIVRGACTAEVGSSGRSSETTFNMVHTDEQFSFDGIAALDAFGKAIPYYCEITVTKNHMWEIDYKIYDIKTGKRLDE